MAITARTLTAMLGTQPGNRPAYLELADALRLLIVDGRLTVGARLPGERELATALGLSRTTTTRAYQQLRDAGFATARRGSGTVVALPLAQSSASTLIVESGDPDSIAWTYSAPPAPPGTARAFERATAALPGLLTSTGYLPDGLPVLREAIARTYVDRGLPTDPGQIVVTAGAMGAISLVTRTLVRRGDRAITEGLSYPHGIDALRAAGARLGAMPVLETPWETDEFARLAAGGARAAYLIPEFHNPTAAIMAAEQREQIARSAKRHDVTVIVDESLHAVNLDGVTLPAPYATFDPSAISIGSSSKPFWGGLRVGWIRAPQHLVMPLIQTRMASDLGASAFDQLVVTELLTEGGQTAASGRARLRSGRDLLLSLLAEQLPDFETYCPAGGLNLWVHLPAAVSSALVTAAAQRGLLLTPGPRFFTQPGQAGERHLRLPFVTGAAQLTEGVHRLADAYAAVLNGASDRRDSTCRGLDLIA
ncbi:PLP-dependent aminotransferase family protein [Branchiibius sp. NY16-3462-2]|uniref:MocR-like transcription factor YczR n=1 Tax=Branchiibius sp. NY16-3462-2 TaxID=1807500 RepID=UPI00079AC348|nr:PLP-dependent aminotransferase family protein [Branchiibius sp. NY16-3462-2]KYH44249.1 hypothetical protein AZH51_06795 [Branchiibius sp. NY16-3462-2]